MEKLSFRLEYNNLRMQVSINLCALDQKSTRMQMSRGVLSCKKSWVGVLVEMQKCTNRHDHLHSHELTKIFILSWILSPRNRLTPSSPKMSMKKLPRWPQSRQIWDSLSSSSIFVYFQGCLNKFSTTNAHGWRKKERPRTLAEASVRHTPRQTNMYNQTARREKKRNKWGKEKKKKRTTSFTPPCLRYSISH